MNGRQVRHRSCRRAKLLQLLSLGELVQLQGPAASCFWLLQNFFFFFPEGQSFRHSLTQAWGLSQCPQVPELTLKSAVQPHLSWATPGCCPEHCSYSAFSPWLKLSPQQRNICMDCIFLPPGRSHFMHKMGWNWWCPQRLCRLLRCKGFYLGWNHWH